MSARFSLWARRGKGATNGAMRRHLVVFVLLLSNIASAQDEVRRVAEDYLNALSGQGSDAGREHLLGGATLNAQIFVLENWKVVSREPARKEKASLARAHAAMEALDKSGAKAFDTVVSRDATGDELTMTELTLAQAQKLVRPTQKRARAFLKQFPVLAYVARVGKEVYWHPKNPMRLVLSQAGKTGNYELEMHLWTVETVEGRFRKKRQWPLRILRFRSPHVDTGWKILPASDWNAE